MATQLRDSATDSKVPSSSTETARQSMSKPSARTPRWFRHSELTAAMAATEEQYQDRIAPIAEATSGQLESLTKKCVARELSFIPNPEFDDAKAADETFALAIELAAPGTAKPKAVSSELPVHLGRMCEAALLKPEQESALFRRMNFLLHQASVQRSLLNTKRPSKARLQLIERLVLLAEWHRDRIVEANVRLVISIVKKFVNTNNSFDELLSEGIVGLMRAVEKFDYDRGFRFSTYATQVVRRNSYRTVVNNQQERQKFASGLQEMDIEIGDEGRSSAIGEKRWHELQGRLANMMNDLDKREKLIIRARFSLGSHRKVHTLQSLADRLGISKERVRQLERRAMDKLRAMAGSEGTSAADIG